MSAVGGTSAHPRTTGKLPGIGVLGCADIALRRVLPAIARSTMANLVAVASRDSHRASDVAHRFACSAMSYRELLRSDEIDLVYIPLPNHLHEEWVIRALDLGKHVLCEKPLGLSLDSVNRMLGAADRNGVLLVENLMYLQHPQHGRIREMLAAGSIGSVTGLTCCFTIPAPTPGSFRLNRQQGGGAFHDLNRYPLSTARFFLRGDICDIVSCDASWCDGMIMSMEATARTTADELFAFSIAFDRPYTCFYQISGTEGTLRLERAFTSPADHECLLHIRRNSKETIIHMPAHDHFRLTIDHVATLLDDSRHFSAEHERARALAHVAERFLLHARAVSRTS